MVTGAATQGSLHVVATHGEIVSTHMPKKMWVKNWLHECQLLASVPLPLGGTVVFDLNIPMLLSKKAVQA